MIVVVVASVSCKRPGTDRELNCQRYAEQLLARTLECGTHTIEGITITGANANAAAKKWARACEENKTISPTAECVRAIGQASCVNAAPDLTPITACAEN